MRRVKWIKLISLLIVLAVSVYVAYLWWDEAAFLLIVLIVLSLMKHFLFPLKREILVFLVFAVIGGLIQSFLLSRGDLQEASRNLNTTLVWAPFLWGLIGTTAFSINDALSGN